MVAQGSKASGASLLKARGTHFARSLVACAVWKQSRAYHAAPCRNTFQIRSCRRPARRAHLRTRHCRTLARHRRVDCRRRACVLRRLSSCFQRRLRLSRFRRTCLSKSLPPPVRPQRSTASRLQNIRRPPAVPSIRGLTAAGCALITTSRCRTCDQVLIASPAGLLAQRRTK